MTIDMHETPHTPFAARRRRLLGVGVRGAAALAGAVLVSGTGAVARAEPDLSFVGSWMVAATPAGAQPSPPRVLVSFTGDGVALRTAPLQQAAPPALGAEKMFISTTHGAWERMDDGTFGMTWVGFAFDDAGRFLATQRVRVSAQLNETLDSFNGPYRTDFVGSDGQIVATVSGTVEGRRIHVEPPA